MTRLRSRQRGGDGQVRDLHDVDALLVEQRRHVGPHVEQEAAAIEPIQQLENGSDDDQCEQDIELIGPGPSGRAIWLLATRRLR